MAILKHCGRCQSKIDCYVDDINNCPCKEVKMTEKLKEFLSLTNYDCLCNNCLEALNNLVNKTPNESKNIDDSDDFYMDGNLFVFTELYHIKRGYCCKSNCRHCAYGYKI
jgi:Family of unknown function (DUF5522)/Cysteine-rich CWC